MEFIKLIETRFADPITALELSKKYVCHGSAMGRIAFHDIEEQKDLVLFDCQPELIRGISHSEDGKHIYISIGDVSCQRLDADRLTVQDNVLIVEDADEKAHKSNCEKALTLLYQHHNCVITLNMAEDQDKTYQPALSISNLIDNILEQHDEGLVFNQNTVPFDFDGHHLLWLVYQPGGLRELFTYSVDTRKTESIIRFAPGDGIISHCKIAKPKGPYYSANPLQIVYVQNTRDIVIYNTETKVSRLVGTATDAVLALDVVDKSIREDLEESKSTSFVISIIDDSEIVSIYDTENQQARPVAKHQVRIKQSKNFPDNYKHKAFFGMGYPYYISSYEKHVAFSTDYGICLLKFED